jgi:hypothetical protein
VPFLLEPLRQEQREQALAGHVLLIGQELQLRKHRPGKWSEIVAVEGLRLASVIRRAVDQSSTALESWRCQ